MAEEALTTLQKALAINLDPCKYGTIAEIGAGQEVARYFFRAGGAAGTIAKTMSAYDMQFSNAIYGEEETRRYVCRSRIKKMLDHEFPLILERVKETRPRNSTFFAFADTVAARGYKSKSECHGWMGLRVQLYPDAEPSEIILHVRMLDDRNEEQAEALGILGVNLIYGAYYHFRNPEELIESMLDNLGRDRVEIDMMTLKGPYFEEVDNRLVALHLVKSRITNAVMFSPEGRILQPSEILYKKNALIFRGSFRPVTLVNMDIAKCGKEKFFSQNGATEEDTVVLAEITMPQLMEGGDVDTKDFLARIDILGELGFNVLISEYLLFSKLRAYLNRYTKRRIAIGLGILNILDIFNERYYDDFEGGILEVFGKLFTGNTQLLVYPYKSNSGELITAKTIRVPEHLQNLYDHLYQNGYIVGLEGCDENLLQYESRKILKALKRGDGDWKEGIPESVYQTIVNKRLFGYDSE